MKNKVMIVIVLLVLMLGSWGAIRQVWASGKCEGGIYEDHPALQVECLHQQAINADINSGAYPEPEGQEPYPAPPATPIVIHAPLPLPHRLPTEPPKR